MADSVLVKFNADYLPVVRATNAIIGQFRSLAGELRKLDEGFAADKFAQATGKIGAEARRAVRGIELLANNLKVLEQAQARFKPGAKSALASRFGQAENLLLNFEGKKTIPRALVDEQIAETINKMRTLLEVLRRKGVDGAKEIQQVWNQFPELQGRIIANDKEHAFIQERIARVLKGQVQDDALRQRLARLREAAKVLQENKVAIEQAVTSQLGRSGDSVDKVRQRANDQRTAALEKQLSLEKALEQNELRRAKAGDLSRRQRNALEKEHQSILDAIAAAQKKQATAEGQLARPEAFVQGGIRLGGADARMAEIDAQISRIRQLQIELNKQGLKGFAPDLVKAIDHLHRVNRQLTNAKEGTKAWRDANAEVLKALLEVERITEETDFTGVDIPQIQSLKGIAASELAALPGLERLFIGAFHDMGRRFQATLQFAISGALIFGAQQAGRRFLETAIEVERAFADIGTAFEFDIEADRGTLEFNRQLQNIRVGILQVADEFNVLPTEANAAAFQMVARFGDVRSATAALRAQLLATKISTIDQAEALRSLSAVAENFASAALFTADGVSIQTKLMGREALAAANYGKALDIATVLQQEFGVAIEDTVEGVGRLAPTFAKLGFSMEQTAAIVGSISRELGLAGSQVADSVNRSIGQLVEPGIRDQLLELAAANENLTLTFDDFENGEKALRALTEQFRQLEQVDPATAFQVLNIIGQRRELDVVAALFNTTELQEAMEQALTGAAGSAERRFDELAKTISEKLASIAGGFERLAQNFSELGFLTPFSAALSVVDKLLVAVNNVLETINQIMTSLGGFGNLLKGVVAFALTRNTITRMAGLITNVASVSLAKGSAFVASKAIPGGLGAALAAGMGGAALEMKKLQTVVSGNRIGLIALARSIAASTVAFQVNARAALAAGLNNRIMGFMNQVAARGPRFQRAVDALDGALARQGVSYARAAGAVGLFATVAIGAVAVLRNFSRVAEQGTLAVQSFQDATRRAEAQARTEKALNPEQFPVEESFQRRLREIQEDLFNQSQAPVQGFLDELQHLFFGDKSERNEAWAELFRLIEKNQGSEISLVEQLKLQTLIPGTDSFQKRLGQEIARARIGDTVTEMLALAVAEGAKPRTLLSETAFLINQPTEAFFAQANELVEMLKTADTPEEVEAAISALSGLQATWTELMGAMGKTASSVEATIKESEQRIARARQNLNLGTGTRTELLEVMEQELSDLNDLAESLAMSKTAGSQELREQVLEKIAQLSQDFVQEQIAALSNQRASLELKEGLPRLRAALSLAEQELQILRNTLGDNAPEIEAKLIEIAVLQKQIADSLDDARLAFAETRVALADTNAEWVAAQIALIKELEKQLKSVVRFADGAKGQEEIDPQALNDANRALEEARRELEDNELDQAQRLAIATARLSGPINDRMISIGAQMKSVQLALAAEEDPLERMELTVQLRELMAQRMQEEVARMSSFAKLQAGVNDQVKSIQAEIVAVTAEVSVSAQIFGRMSTEFLDASLRLAELKESLAQTLLSLDDINRRLGTDLSNDFEQAIFDLQLIAEKLQAPNLGGLEEAQLLLDKQRGEMQAERAFFSTELFNLRFLTETGQLGQGAYLDSLRGLLSQVDTTTQQGKEIFLEIQSLIDGLTEDVGDLAFNVPTAIRLPTIFEVRRALAADQLGVNYMDNRQMDIIVHVRDATDVEALVASLGNALGTGGITSTAGRFAPGASSLTLGGF